MQTTVFKIQKDAPDLEKIRQAAKILDEGGLVAFPTETVYGIACRVGSDSLKKLDKIKNRTAGKHYTLHIASRKNVGKYVPHQDLRIKKLINYSWPGPLTVVFELNSKQLEETKKQISPEVFENIYNNSIGIRCPDNNVALILLDQTQNEVVAPSANLAGKPPPVTAEQVLQQLDGKINCVLDGGKCRYGKSSTVVKIGKTMRQILREGVLPIPNVMELSNIKVLFVCTGNTCRSPMAQGIFAHRLAEKLGVKVDRLEKIGYKVSSAGIMNIGSMPAATEALQVCAKRGVDIRTHRSQPLTRQLVKESDFIFVMTGSHCRRVEALDASAAQKCELLAAPDEIPDPISQSRQIYELCAERIEKAVNRRISEFSV